MKKRKFGIEILIDTNTEKVYCKQIAKFFDAV